MSEVKTVSAILKSIFDSRKNRNKGYSLRAFARDLGISPGRLSDILSDTTIPGSRLILRIVKALKLGPYETESVLRVVEKQRRLYEEFQGAKQLSNDEFSVIVDREHFSVLCLMETEGFKSDLSWMAERLGISAATVEKVLERLLRMGLISFDKGYKSLHKDVTTSHNIPSQAIREYHLQGLQHSMESLMQDDPSLRDITSIEMAVNMKKMDEVREHIRDFRRKIANLMEEGDKTEVYRLNIQLVPVTSVSSNKKGSSK